MSSYKLLKKNFNPMLEVAYNFYYLNETEPKTNKTLAKAKIFYEAFEEYLKVGVLKTIDPNSFFYQPYKWVKQLPGISQLIPAISWEEKKEIFDASQATLEKAFQYISDKNQIGNHKSIAYFVSTIEHNGAFLSKAATMYHLNVMNTMQEQGFNIYPYTIWSLEDIKKELITLKIKNIPIDIIQIGAHGWQKGMNIYDLENKNYISHKSNFTFENLNSEYDIVLISCSTGKGNNPIAAEIAHQNPGSVVFGATEDTFFADVIFKNSNDNKGHYVEEVEHHYIWSDLFILPNIYVMDKFSFSGDVAKTITDNEL